jgi:hypothetical protein
LEHDRTNFSKNKALFPAWTESGRPTLAVAMHHTCGLCDTGYLANDARTLNQLDPHMREPCKVDPKRADGTFHFNMDLTDNMEDLLKTHANGAFVGKKLHRKLGKQHARKVETHLSQFPSNAPPCQALNPPSFHDFTRGFSPPSAAAIRASHASGYHSSHAPHGRSQHERNAREITNVKVHQGDVIALDWTFGVVHNHGGTGAKAMFAANVGRTNEVLALALVLSTSVSQASHMLIEMLRKRPNFDPSVLCHDTCPHNKDFWAMIFGVNLEVRLGLFHLLHRIVHTLDPKCELCWKALVALKKSACRCQCTDDYPHCTFATLNPTVTPTLTPTLLRLLSFAPTVTMSRSTPTATSRAFSSCRRTLALSVLNSNSHQNRINQLNISLITQ